MVRGLDIFQEWFAAYADRYVLIGGTAASLTMEEAGLAFRATKDLDIVLHVEALTAAFGDAFWKFVEAGGYDPDEKLWLLKGESKSRANLGNLTIADAREALNRHSGRCTPDSLLFIANRLLDSTDKDDAQLGRTIRDEVGLKALRANRIDHMLFTVSGNAPAAKLQKDLEEAGEDRNQHVVSLHIEDHQAFIAEAYAEAMNFRNK